MKHVINLLCTKSKFLPLDQNIVLKTLINLSRGKGYFIDFGSNGMSGRRFVYLTRQMSPERSMVPPGRRFLAGERAGVTVGTGAILE